MLKILLSVIRNVLCEIIGGVKKLKIFQNKKNKISQKVR